MMRVFDAKITLLIISLCSSWSQGYQNERRSMRGASRRTENDSNGREGNGNTYTNHRHGVEDYPSSSSSLFDFYVLSMSYQPEFCFQHRHEGFYGCENPMDFWRGNLTLHGLWPEGNDGSWPSMCTNEKFNTQTVSEIGRTKFNTYWPNVKASKSSTSYTYYSFWDHEWTKHGTCSGLCQVKYFNTTMNHFLATPSIVRENYGGSVLKKELLDAYGGNVVLVCSGGRYLMEVRTCVGKNFDGTASKSVECIPQVQQEGHCGNIIQITKFL